MAAVTTTEPVTTPASELLVPPDRLHRITVDDYLKMGQAGILTEKDRVYLWKGLVVTKMSKGRAHTMTTLRISDALRPLVVGVGYIEPEQPVRLVRRDDTMPEPDVKVVRGRGEDYADVPTTADVPLVVEVADSSLLADRAESMPLYAAEGVPVYWLANIPRRRIEVTTGPTATGYGPPAVYERGQSVAVVLDGVEVGRIAVSDIFRESDPWLRAGGS